MKAIGLVLLCLCLGCVKKPAAKAPAPPPAESAEPKPTENVPRTAPKGDPDDGGENK